MLEDLEPNTDNDIIDITDFLERPANDKRSPSPKCDFTTHTTQRHCPTPQNSPAYLSITAMAATPTKPHRTEIWEILPDKKRVPNGWPTCLRKQPPRSHLKQ